MDAKSIEIITRVAERKDCESLIKLKKELAVHQNMANRPMLTIKDLERDGFDKQPPCFQCIVAESVSKGDNNEEVKAVVGFALYFYAYTAWEGKAIHLEDLCVTSSLRGKHIGEKLIKKLAQIGVEENFCRIQLEVLNWNESAIKFYKKLGAINFTAAEGWHDFALDSNAIKLLASS